MSENPLCLSPQPVAGCDCGAGLARCLRCGGLGRAGDAPCPDCEASGYLPACANCGSEPVDALRAPYCSSACEEEHAAKAKLDAIRGARVAVKVLAMAENCAWNGWDDADHDAWTIGACRERGWR